MGKDIRFDKDWGKKRKGLSKNKRRANKKALKTNSDFSRKFTRTLPYSEQPAFEDYCDPDDGFEKFENNY